MEFPLLETVDCDQNLGHHSIPLQMASLLLGSRAKGQLNGLPLLRAGDSKHAQELGGAFYLETNLNETWGAQPVKLPQAPF